MNDEKSYLRLNCVKVENKERYYAWYTIFYNHRITRVLLMHVSKLML